MECLVRMFGEAARGLKKKYSKGETFLDIACMEMWERLERLANGTAKAREAYRDILSILSQRLTDARLGRMEGGLDMASLWEKYAFSALEEGCGDTAWLLSRDLISNRPIMVASTHI